MAMSLRPSRPQSVRTQPQNLRPQVDWRDEDGATLLLVYLPDFVKEQIRTTYDESTRSIKLQGELRLPNNKRIRIDERCNVPEKCEGSKMETQFSHGILTLTLPKIKPETEPELEAPRLSGTVGEEESVSSTYVDKQRNDEMGKGGEEGKENVALEMVASKIKEKENEEIAEESYDDFRKGETKEKNVEEKEENAVASAKKGQEMELNEHGTPLTNTVVAALVILGLSTSYFYACGK